MKNRCALGLVIASFAMGTPMAMADELLYSENFERYRFGPEWSGSKTITDMPYHIFSAFSGRYGNTYTQLTLAPLPMLPPPRLPQPGNGDGDEGGGGGGGGGGAHYVVTVTWDLYILDSWDGNDAGGWGEDRFSLFAQNVPIFSETFANQPGVTQTFAGVPAVGPVPLAWNRYNDSIYRDISANFAYESGDITLRWMDHGLQSLDDESWGLDNVRVTYSVVPGPGSVAIAGVVAAAGFARRRRR